MASRTLLIVLLALVSVMLGACVPNEAVSNDVETITINGQTFFLEIAATNDKRFKGLSGREQIEADGGMIFVFSRPRVLNFVMRDCLVPIDIAFLDQFGTVVATHEMPIEPREPGESDQAYESRLTSFSSNAAAMFALEFKAGKIRELGLERGDKVELDTTRLQRIAQ
jgi:uncharacterized membrane protein (UPF0127 family)